MLYALMSRIPETYSIITELKLTRERLASSRIPFMRPKITPITIPASGRGSSETSANGTFTDNR